MDVQDFAARLQREMPEDLPVLAVREVPIGAKAVASRITGWAYQVDAPKDSVDEALVAVENFLAAESVPVEVTRKGTTRTVDMRPVVKSLSGNGEGGWRLEVDFEGPGARVRDVLRAVWGDDAAKVVSGWSASRVQTYFRDEAGV